MSRPSLPRIVISIGDPAGIGPEITRAALRDPRVKAACLTLVAGNVRLVPGLSGARVISVPLSGRIVPGRLTLAGGHFSFRCVERAVDIVLSGQAQALVTAPIAKNAWQAAGARWAGHTEYLAYRAGVRSFCMMMTAGTVTAALATRHIPLNRVPRAITARLVRDTVLTGAAFVREQCGIARPRIAVCALNPHAGESGLIGHEERDIIAPALKGLAGGPMIISGPLPADSAWAAVARGEHDLIVALYHDQAMIGLKCLDPRKIVNVTAGLPFVRTSPGHGTAFDIAGRGRADPEPMIQALLTAARLIRP